VLVTRSPLDPQAETSSASTTTRVAPHQPTRILRDAAHLVDRRPPRFTSRGYLFQRAGAMLHLCSEPTIRKEPIPSRHEGVPGRTRVRLIGRQLSTAAARRGDHKNLATRGGDDR
jgi:hypothetical protein